MLIDDIMLLRPYAYDSAAKAELPRCAEAGVVPSSSVLARVRENIEAELDAADAGGYEDSDAEYAYAALHRVK